MAVVRQDGASRAGVDSGQTLMLLNIRSHHLEIRPDRKAVLTGWNDDFRHSDCAKIYSCSKLSSGESFKRMGTRLEGGVCFKKSRAIFVFFSRPSIVSTTVDVSAINRCKAFAPGG